MAKTYKGGEQPAKLDLVTLLETGTKFRVDDINADGWIVCGFNAYDPATMALESRGMAAQQASGPALVPVQAPNVIQHGRPAPTLVGATIQPRAPAPSTGATALGMQVGRQSPDLLRARLAECRKKLKPCTKDHEAGSRVARRLDELAGILDDLILSALFPEPEEPRSSKPAKTTKAPHRR